MPIPRASAPDKPAWLGLATCEGSRRYGKNPWSLPLVSQQIGPRKRGNFPIFDHLAPASGPTAKETESRNARFECPAGNPDCLNARKHCLSGRNHLKKVWDHFPNAPDNSFLCCFDCLARALRSSNAPNNSFLRCFDCVARATRSNNAPNNYCLGWFDRVAGATWSSNAPDY